MEFPNITIIDVPYRERAQPLIDALEGQSYLKLHVEVQPRAGVQLFDVLVTTPRPNTSKDELTSAVLQVLSAEVCGIYARRPTIREVP